MNKDDLKTALQNIIDKYNGVFSAQSYQNPYAFNDIDDLANTPLQSFIDDVTSLFKKERAAHRIEFGGMQGAYDGEAVEADFAVIWMEPCPSENELTISDVLSSLEIMTFKLLSEC